MINIISFIKKYWLTGVVLLLCVSIAINVMMCNHNADIKRQAAAAEQLNAQNMKAIFDSIRYIRTRLGDTMATRAIYIATLEQLKNMNKDLYNKINSIGGNVASIIDSKLSVSLPGVSVGNDLKRINDSLYALNFNYTYVDSGLSSEIGGRSQFYYNGRNIYADRSYIDRNVIKMDLTYGFREDSGYYYVFAQSPSRYVKFNSLNGAYVIKKNSTMPFTPEQKKSRFSIGPTCGIFYGMNEKKFDVGLGFCMTYSLFNLDPRKLKTSNK